MSIYINLIFAYSLLSIIYEYDFISRIFFDNNIFVVDYFYFLRRTAIFSVIFLRLYITKNINHVCCLGIIFMFLFFFMYIFMTGKG